MRPRTRRALVLVIALAALAALYRGWRVWWFLTDDAFIEFRYVQNSLLGFGYTWNAPPFLPVEGYTSFLWVALLDATWRVTGVPPPESANTLGLLCGVGSLAATALMLARVDLGRRLSRARLAVVTIGLAGVLANRTFLTWLSSGLETPLFMFLILAWVAASLFTRRRGAAYALGVTAAAGLIELTRPDGLLFAAASLPLVLFAPPAPGRRAWTSVLGAWPLLLVPAHVLWRRHRYGEWLPNTYYAKVVAPWPEAGVRYLGSFCLEYAWWLLFPLALLALAKTLGRLRAALVARRGGLRATLRTAVVAGALLAHLAYYTLRVGGDHFEYRVFAQLVPLGFVAAAWLLGRFSLPRAAGLSGLAALVAASLPIPWAHWALTRDAPPLTFDRPHVIIPVAPAFPPWPWLRRYVGEFDELQAWLIPHAVCVRQQEHKRFYTGVVGRYPKREIGSKLPASNHPIIMVSAAGVIGWVAPHVAVIDRLGLNDYVIARSPVPPEAYRKMAHDRHPPPGYVECFEPNVSWTPWAFTVTPRLVPVTDATIRECEARFRKALK
jgi:arabinofuranosyltransferase